MANVLWLPSVCIEGCGRIETDAYGREQFYAVLAERRRTWRCPTCDEAWRAVQALGTTATKWDAEWDDDDEEEEER